MDLFQVVLLSVLATLTQVSARPADKDCKTKDGYTDQPDDYEKLKFKLPTAFKPNYTMTLKGYLNFSEENFIAVLSVKGDQDYIINFNYKTNDYLKTYSTLDDQKQTMEYEMEILKETKDYTQIQDTEVILQLTARENRKASKFLDITFNGYSIGPSSPISLPIESFDDLNHIHFKEGVKNITSILFDMTTLEVSKV